MNFAYLDDNYVPGALTPYATFPPNGVGPFVVSRDDIINEVLGLANPQRSVHITGCKGAGKSTILFQITERLQSQGKRVYFLYSTGTILTDQHLSNALKELMNYGQEAFVLLDETQDAKNTNDALTRLLKNYHGHKVTVIGAGISNLDSNSNRFGHTIRTDRLFLSEDDLQSKGCYDHFCRGADVGKHEHIRKLIAHINEYAGGHVYPVMRLSELLVPLITRQVDPQTGEEAITALYSEEFRQSIDFHDVEDRITPPPPTDLRPLLYATKDPTTMDFLVKKGICRQDGKIVSHLLFDLYTGTMAAAGPRYGQKLEQGVEGIRQVLCFALPKMHWDQYNPHGGAVEDALTFELMLHLHGVTHLKTKLFNPKLIDARTSRRRPDIFMNSTVNSYVECVRTTGHTKSDMKSLEEHINRFRNVGASCEYYQIGERNWAILHYQVEGTDPLVPKDSSLAEVFKERVFTFTMVNKAVFRGHELITT